MKKNARNIKRQNKYISNEEQCRVYQKDISNVE